MSATHEPKREGNGTLHPNGTGAGLAAESANAQVHERQVDYAKLLALGRDLLIALGDDPDRAGLADTPRRWASMWREFIEYEPGKTDTAFETQVNSHLVIVRGVRVWSMCEHHLLPFWCDISIGYIPSGTVLGLSKFGRIAHQFAHQLQLQESLTHDILQEVKLLSGSEDVIVSAKGQHLCMVSRGIRSQSDMVTLTTSGVFATSAVYRSEFLDLVRD